MDINYIMIGAFGANAVFGVMKKDLSQVLMSIVVVIYVLQVVMKVI